MPDINYPFSRVLEVMKPNKIKKENATQVAKLEECLRSSEYGLEMKIDGHHYTAIGGRFFSTHISDKTGQPVEKTGNFPHLVEALKFADMGNLILDGEINYPGKKSQDISSISNSAADKAIALQEQQGWIYYTVYDILRAPNGEWLINKPWRVRREYLEAVCVKLSKICPYLKINPVYWNNKAELVDQWLEDGEEGGVLKFVNGLYILGKRPMWNQMKIKQEDEDDVVIMGFLPPEELYTGKNLETWQYWKDDRPVTKHYYHGLIGSIQIGKYNKDGELVEVGSVTGMKEYERADFTNNPEQYVGKVIKIKGMERTYDGAYRHFNFVEVHADKNPHECKLV